MEHESHTPDASDQPGPPLLDRSELSDRSELAERRELIAHHMAALEDLIDPEGRSDGWTPAARMGFLRLVAEHGRVSHACQCIGLSKQSVYSLRARDPLFAIGWDAACQLSRMPLADTLYEQAADGLTDTITRDDGRTVTRHRIDSRLSIAVLNRLDRRCDKAAETGSHHLGAIAHWDEFVAAIGNDDQSAAQAIIDDHAANREDEILNAETSKAKTVNVSQPSQLPLGGDDAVDDENLPDPRIWWESGRTAYRTNFPPPDGSDCHEHEHFGHRDYHRALTDAEATTMAARDDARAAKRRAADETERDAFFASLGEAEVPPPSAAPTPPPGKTWGGAKSASPSPSPSSGEEPTSRLQPRPRANGMSAEGGGAQRRREQSSSTATRSKPPNSEPLPDQSRSLPGASKHSGDFP